LKGWFLGQDRQQLLVTSLGFLFCEKVFTEIKFFSPSLITYHHHSPLRNLTLFVYPKEKVSCFAFCHSSPNWHWFPLDFLSLEFCNENPDSKLVQVSFCKHYLLIFGFNLFNAYFADFMIIFLVLLVLDIFIISY
jgi:hypothetical protein